MEHVAWHLGLEICRTSAGHLVVVDPHDSWENRASLVEVFAESDMLDFLFFPTVDDAVLCIEESVARSRLSG